MAPLSAIVTSHSFERGLRFILGQLRYQTDPPEEILAYVSGEGYDLLRLREHFPEVEFIEVEDAQDWGHSKRAMGVQAASEEFLGFFNDDDAYARTYVKTMVDAAYESFADAVYCNWNFRDCGFHLGSSTSGNFIVRSDLAREVGYPDTGQYESDGHFINGISGAGHVVKVHEDLYTWNALDR